MTDTVLVPQLRGMDESHRQAIVSSFQSVQRAISSAVKAGTSGSASAATTASLQAQINALKAQIAALSGTSDTKATQAVDDGFAYFC